MATSWVSVTLLATGLLGCALDNRTLHLAEDQGEGGGDATGAAGSSSGAIHRPDPPAPIELPACSYSGEVEPGCETLVDNAGFSAGIDSWQAEPLAITVGWEAGDADGSDHSGSIGVVNAMHGRGDGIAPGGGMQCVPATPGAVYDMAADVFVPEGQGAGIDDGPYSGQAGLSVLFWPNSDCSDNAPTLGSFQSNLAHEAGVWTRVEGTSLAPDKTAAMSVRVLTVKPFKQFSFKAAFDNVLVRKR